MSPEPNGTPRSLEDEPTVHDTSYSARPRYQRRSDLYHTLHADHEEVRRLFARIADAEPAEHAARWNQLSLTLTAHNQAEFEVVYPRSAGDGADHWVEEHEEILALMGEIDALPRGDATFQERIRRLQRMVEHHVDEEEQRLLPAVEGSMEESELDVLTLRFEQRKRKLERELVAGRTVTLSVPVPDSAARGRGPGDPPYIVVRERRMRGRSGNRRPEPAETRKLAIPLRDVAPRAPESFVERTRSRGAFLQARILIVDDLTAHARLLQRILVNASYSRVETTTDPVAVFGLHRQNPYDLILLDLDMPRMDGFEVMESLKRLDPDGHLPVVALASEPNEQLRALRAGARDVISKPFDVKEVLGRVSSVLETRMPEIARRQRYRGLERDLAVAAEIYRALLPTSLPCCPGYELTVVSRSADDTGGDVYDVVARPDGSLVLLLADATGHGIGPALSATQLRSMVRIALRLGASLDGIVAEADRQLAADLPDDRFVTAFIGEIDPVTHTLEYLAAGQGPLLHWHAATGTAEWRNASGPPLGVAIAPFVRPPPMRLAVGDVVVLATDGVFERTDIHGDMFGKVGVEAVMRDSATSTAQAIGQLLQTRTDHHGGAHPADDDATFIVLKRTF